MTNQTQARLPIPGLKVVGRGIYLRPYQPYALKEILFRTDNTLTYYSKETGQTYMIPEGYEVNDSPPMPAKQALNQVIIEESWERFDKQMGLDANLTVSGALFSIDVNASQLQQLRCEEEAYYALRNSFVPLWTVYLPTVTAFSDMSFDMDVPTPFDHSNRSAYERFFERYGTHYVRRAWVGGKAMLAFTVTKSSKMTKDEIQAGIKASLVGVGSSGADASLKKSKEKLQNNSECTVFGKGGDELKLAAISSLDEAHYNEWLATIKDNPQVIELEVSGIWTLTDDKEKAKALQEAYREATAFKPISAVFGIDKEIYFVRGDKYFCYHIDKCESEKPRPIIEKWPILSQLGFDRIHAALRWDGKDSGRKLFLFKRDKYLCLDIDTGSIGDGCPRPIAQGWPGVTFERIDAALNIEPDSVYFFMGNRYIRYSMSENHADKGYPDIVPRRWTGVTFDRIDASICWGDGKVYFFRGDQHIRYDMITYRADPGYPKFIIGCYVEDWKFFD
ncbi:hemopexin repeat-containing protein [Desulfobacterales bacterium HSG2]|nr:hemopexin repeat-containing protein [Desulfobacterales bacterium HSG2]